MKAYPCVWCSALCKVPDNFNPLLKDVVCSKTCREAELLFQLHFSDEAINRRAHYRAITKGEDTDDEEDESLQKKQRIQHPPPQSKK